MLETAPKEKPKIFIVEDKTISEAIKDSLENLGYSVPDTASSGEKAKKNRSNPPRLSFNGY